MNEKQVRLNALISVGTKEQATEEQNSKCRPRPYVYELLSLLSAIQTEISDVSKVLLRPLMGELMKGIFSQFVVSIRSIEELKITSEMFRQLDAEIAILEDLLATGMSEEATELALACHSALGLLVGKEEKVIRFPKHMLSKQFSSFQYT